MFCPQCGAPNEDDAVFCGNCGAVLNPEEAARAEAQMAAEEPEATSGEEATRSDRPAEPTPPMAPAPPPMSPAPPRPAYAVPASVPTSGLALASLLLGIGGLTILPLLGSILALVFGYMARNDIRQRPDEVSGNGLAVAGIVMGWIAVGLAAVGLLLGAGLLACGVCGAIGAGNQ
jgi:hypothetical protein